MQETVWKKGVIEMLKNLGLWEELEGKPREDVLRKRRELRALHTHQVVAQRNLAKARGDHEEAERPREWLVDLFAQSTTLGWYLDGPKAGALEAVDDERVATMSREEKIALATELDSAEEGLRLTLQAMECLKRGDHDEWRRLMVQVCELWGLPPDLYGLE